MNRQGDLQVDQPVIGIGHQDIIAEGHFQGMIPGERKVILPPERVDVRGVLPGNGERPVL